jgi:cell division protein FtsL
MKDFPRYGTRDSKNLVRKKTTDAKRSSLKLAVSWIIMILIALFFVQQRISYIRMEKRVRALLEQKENIQMSILPLTLEERFLTQQEKVEQVAGAELNLQIPIPSQVITIDVNNPK